MPTISPDLIPATQGTVSEHYDGRYRLYTVDVLPFDAVPTWAGGGPALVAHTSWGVSQSTGAHIEGARLNVYRYPGQTGWGERHPLDGTLYPDCDQAHRAAYEAGALAFMIYNKEAPRWGLPA